jgi:hypothetical protein
MQPRCSVTTSLQRRVATGNRAPTAPLRSQMQFIMSMLIESGALPEEVVSPLQVRPLDATRKILRKLAARPRDALRRSTMQRTRACAHTAVSHRCVCAARWRAVAVFARSMHALLVFYYSVNHVLLSVSHVFPKRIFPERSQMQYTNIL